MKLDLKSGLVGVAGAVTVGALALGGAALANAEVPGVSAQSAAAATSTASPTGPPGPGRGRGPGGRGAPGQQDKRPDLSVHGLSGDVAVKVTQAAVAKEPTAYLLRVAKSADGAYRAHMARTDGTHILVHIDANFAVTSVQELPKKPGRPKPGGTATSAPSST